MQEPTDGFSKKRLFWRYPFPGSGSPLRAEDRKLFVRRYWYGEDMSALADLFGISENGAAVKLFRVRHKMKSYLEKEGFTV